MIYIVEKSKKTSNFNRKNLSLEDAKQFVYELTTQDFRINSYFIYGADKDEELEDFINYFSKKYIKDDKNDEMSGVYTINGKIKKYHRLATKGASISALNRFKKKIEDAIPLSEVDLTFNTDSFELSLQHPTGDIKLICDYQLTILKSFAKNKDGEFIDIEQKDLMVKTINDIFRKQRYYYKKKG